VILIDIDRWVHLNESIYINIERGIKAA